MVLLLRLSRGMRTSRVVLEAWKVYEEKVRVVMEKQRATCIL